MKRSLDDILAQLGGESEVALSLGCGRSAISNWKVRGVPKGRLVDLVDLAKMRGVDLSIDDVRAAAPGPPPPEAEPAPPANPLDALTADLVEHVSTTLNPARAA